MKKALLLTFIPTLLLGLVGCGNSNNNSSNNPQYNEDFLYNEPVYEPLDIAHENQDVFVSSTDLLGVYYGVKAAAWDDYDIKLRVNYSDGSMHDFPIKVINIPLDMRHYLGEVGEQHIYLIEHKWTVTHTFNIIENPDWHGYKCEFFDKDKNYLTTQTVGFYEEVKYNGPEIPSQQDDFDYQYNFIGWNRPTTYIHQDMQFVTKYEKVEKRFYGLKPFNNDHIGLSALVDESGQKGSGLVYLGRVRHVAGYHTEAKELGNEDLEFNFKMKDYGSFFNEFNADIVKNAISFKDDLEYSSKIYGNPYSLINNPNFGLQFDSRYDFKGTKALLEDQSDVTISSLNPYDGTFDKLIYKIDAYRQPAIVSKDEEPGYYRYSMILSFDVYLSVSFTKLDEHVYELGVFNSFYMAPVADSIVPLVQYSKDGNFSSNFDHKLVVSTKGLYYTAEMISWGK